MCPRRAQVGHVIVNADLTSQGQGDQDQRRIRGVRQPRQRPGRTPTVQKDGDHGRSGGRPDGGLSVAAAMGDEVSPSSCCSTWCSSAPIRSCRTGRSAAGPTSSESSPIADRSSAWSGPPRGWLNTRRSVGMLVADRRAGTQHELILIVRLTRARCADTSHRDCMFISALVCAPAGSQAFVVSCGPVLEVGSTDV